MNKQEILDRINQIKSHLAYLEENLEECECERWSPNKGKVYYLVTEFNNVGNIVYHQDNLDKARYDAYNCFKTREEAEQESEKILVRRQLEDIAQRLNKKTQNEFNAYKDYKYYLYIHDNTGKIDLGSNLGVTTQGVVYCLSEDFYKVAIEEIGQERLKNYLLSYSNC